MFKYIILLLPSFLKIRILRYFGASIGAGSYIGFSLVDAKDIIIEDYVYIGHFNFFSRLNVLYLGRGSRFTMFNWVTGARNGSFSIGRNSAVTRFHFFEASGNITIGNNCIVAGRNSHFFTHGISSNNLDDIRPIFISDWCYLGSDSKFVPGSCIARGTFVGMGSVVTKSWQDEYVLLAGAPAVVKKKLSHTDVYFDRNFLPHCHHPRGYSG